MVSMLFGINYIYHFKQHSRTLLQGIKHWFSTKSCDVIHLINCFTHTAMASWQPVLYFLLQTKLNCAEHELSAPHVSLGGGLAGWLGENKSANVSLFHYTSDSDEVLDQKLTLKSKLELPEATDKPQKKN